MFLISLKAGGVGLTLTEADYVFVLDPWWNPAVEAQAVDRAHRIGQREPVIVYRLVSADTIEEKVMELKARKAALFAQVVDGEGGSRRRITADDIRALFDWALRVRRAGGAVRGGRAASTVRAAGTIRTATSSSASRVPTWSPSAPSSGGPARKAP